MSKPLVVSVEVRTVYGNDLIYPVNEPAKIFASLDRKSVV